MTTDMVRPISAYPCQGDNSGYNEPLMDTNIKVGTSLLGPGFKQHLEKFYSKASPEDKARCLELLTSINISQKLREQTKATNYTIQTPTPVPPSTKCPRRPYTAMADLDRPRPADRDPHGAYMTSYNRDYMQKQATTSAYRPRSHRGHGYRPSYDLGGGLGDTTYQEEFDRKLQAWQDPHERILQKPAKPEPIRSGTASGNRRNNPHPLKPFMVWKIGPSGPTRFTNNSAEPPISDDLLDQVMRGKIRSTYQEDYLGIPQGYQMKSSFDGGLTGFADNKSNVPYSLDSFQRHIYRKPVQQEELKTGTSRYSSNKTKSVPAYGGAPAISSRHMHVNGDTHYDDEFNDSDTRGPHQVRDVARALGAQSMQNYISTATGQEKEQMERMMHTMNSMAPPAYGRSQNATNGRAYRYKVPPTATQNPPVTWASHWGGPM